MENPNYVLCYQLDLNQILVTAMKVLIDLFGDILLHCK